MDQELVTGSDLSVLSGAMIILRPFVVSRTYAAQIVVPIIRYKMLWP